MNYDRKMCFVEVLFAYGVDLYCGLLHTSCFGIKLVCYCGSDCSTGHH